MAVLTPKSGTGNYWEVSYFLRYFQAIHSQFPISKNEEGPSSLIFPLFNDFEI